MDRLVQHMYGDVDILAGPLNWTAPEQFLKFVELEHADNPDRHVSWNYELATRKLALEGGIQWPPFFGHLVGIEAKCAYLPRNTGHVTGGLKSTKSGSGKVHQIRNEIDKLLDLGLDHVVLLDIIANPPESGIDGWAFVNAYELAERSAEEMDLVLRERLPKDSEAAHWIWKAGSVEGGDESLRGVGGPTELRTGKGNSRLVNSIATQANRKEMEGRLRAIFSTFAKPTTFPAVYVDCERCKKIHAVPFGATGCGNRSLEGGRQYTAS